MNCRLFEGLITDLVREEGLEREARSQALAHASRCRDCSARLAHHRALRAVTQLAAAEREEAPAGLEERLLTAYRQRQAIQPRDISARRTFRARTASYWGIAAALLVVILGAAAYRSLLNPPSSGVPGAEAGPAAPKVSRPPVLDRSPIPAAQNAQPLPAPANAPPGPKKPPPVALAENAQQADLEVATDFFSLTTGNDLNSMESAQLVRVLMPRNVMASYGLPVNQERIDKPVTAQVLIGQDGVARAIRFLSEPNANFIQTGMRTKR